jgi:hypothetical protein
MSFTAGRARAPVTTGQRGYRHGRSNRYSPDLSDSAHIDGYLVAGAFRGTYGSTATRAGRIDRPASRRRSLLRQNDDDPAVSNSELFDALLRMAAAKGRDHDRQFECRQLALRPRRTRPRLPAGQA